ncbi:MAG: VWA domain-containing protein [Chlamydiales bacterium]|nr:VWA domain-containing protein [Chlamydiales bacterium]
MSVLLADGIVYANPKVAFLLLAAPIILLLYWLLDRERKAVTQQFLGSNLNHRLSISRSRFQGIFKGALLALAWMAAVIALMEPGWQRVHGKTLAKGSSTDDQLTTVSLQRRPHDIVFFLDTSASMTVADTVTGQTRLEKSQDLIADTITRLSGENLGLYTFTIDIKALVPPTLDHLYLRMLLRTAMVNDTGLAGSDFQRVFSLVRQAFWAQPTDKLYTLIFFTDGDDTKLATLPSSQRSEYMNTILSALGDIDPTRIRLYAVGMGSTEPKPVPGLTYEGKPIPSALNADFLHDLAKKGHGVYFQANNYEGLDLSDELATQITEGLPMGSQPSSQPIIGRGLSLEVVPPATPLHSLPLLLAILLIAATLALPEGEAEKQSLKRLGSALVPIFLALSNCVYAEDPALFVEARQYDKALQIYRGLQTGQLEGWQRSLVMYDIGVILLEQQRWEEAIKAFESTPIAAESSPLLRMRYYYNLAIALLGYAQGQEGLFSTDDPAFIDRYRNLQISLRRAQAALIKAEEADCELAKFEGAKNCYPTLATEAAKERLKQMLVTMSREQREYEAAQLSVGQKASKLLVAIEEEKRWLTMVGESHITLQADVEQMRVLEPLWGSFRFDERVEGNKELVTIAYKAFQEALKALENNDALGAKQKLIESANWLKVILYISAGNTESEALLKVRVSAEALAESSPVLDSYIKLTIQNSEIEKVLGDYWDKPSDILTLYRISSGQVGAIVADIWDNPRESTQLSLLEQNVGSMTDQQRTTLLKAVQSSTDQLQASLESMALAWDIKGFIQERLSSLIIPYSLSWAHRTLSESAFVKLQDSLTQLKDFLELPDVSKMISLPMLKENLGSAMSFQALGLQAMQSNQLEVARIFLGEALYWLQEGYAHAFSVPAELAEQLLRRALAELRHSMLLVSQVMQLPTEQRSSASPYAKDLHEAMRLAQKQPQIWSAPFISTVLVQQRQAFDSSGNQDRSCQKRPWNDVMPLYFLGENATERATQNLSQGTSSLSNVLDDQKVAYRKWLKALELLQDTKPSATSSEVNQQTETRIPGVPSQNPSIEDTLKLLQQMDREDREKSAKQTPVKGGDGRPW